MMMRRLTADASVVLLFILLLAEHGAAFAPQRSLVGSNSMWVSSSSNSIGRTSVVVNLIDIDAVTSAVSVDQVPKTTMGSAPPPPPPPPPVVAVADTKAAVVASAPEPVVALSPPPAATAVIVPPASGDGGSIMALPSVDLPTLDGLPLPVIGVGVLAAFAAATFAMRGSVDEREATAASSSSSSSTPAAATSTTPAGPDLSVPYDAAARLAYEKSSKSMGYEAFRKKYEADAVADVTAKAQRKQTA